MSFDNCPYSSNHHPHKSTHNCLTPPPSWQLPGPGLTIVFIYIMRVQSFLFSKVAEMESQRIYSFVSSFLEYHVLRYVYVLIYIHDFSSLLCIGAVVYIYMLDLTVHLLSSLGVGDEIGKLITRTVYQLMDIFAWSWFLYTSLDKSRGETSFLSGV